MIVQSRERGIVAVLVPLLVFILLLGVLVPFFVFGKVVPPDKIGVRQNYYTVFGLLKKGYEKDGLLPGLHWQVPGLSSISLLPGTFQLVHLNESSEQGDYDGRELDVPTTDGSKVRTDVTLVVRLYDAPSADFSRTESRTEERALPMPEKGDEVPNPPQWTYQHGGPREVIDAYTASQSNVLQKISEVSENQLRGELSRLSTSDFYNPAFREAAAIRAHDAINRLVALDGVQIWATLIRRYVYAEQKIDDQIFAKNLQDQTERLNAAASRLAAAKADTERERAIWDAKIGDLKVKGESEVRVVESEGKLYESKQIAEGDLLVSSAKAEVDGAKASVLSRAEGADIYVAREMAPIVTTLRGGVVSGLDPFDVKGWVQRLTGRK